MVIFGLLSVSYIANKDIRPIQGADCSLSTDKAKCEALEKKAKAYQDLIDIKNKTQISLQNQLAVIDVQQQKTQTELTKTKSETEELSQHIDNLEKEITVQEKTIQYQKGILSGLMQSYYADYQQGLLNIVLAGESFSNILAQSDYIEHSSLKVSDILTSIREGKERLDKQKRELGDKKTEQEKLKIQLEEKNLALQYSETQKQTLLGKTQAEKEKYQNLLDNIENEISSLEQSLSGTINMANLPPDKSGYFTWPVNPHVITQGYGATTFAKTSGMYKNNFHNGLDFGIKYSNVYAAKGGKVVGSGDNGKYAYGKWLAIDHGDGLVTLYGHLSEKAVVRGDRVTEGQKIGISGNTGNSTGPHLHFSVFASSTFKTVESSYVDGLMIPTGAPVTPKKYL